MELGIAYELIHPDGTRIVVGNSDVAKADPDYVGFLDAESGIAGLDSPDLRESAAEIVGGHGGIHYDFLHGRRPIVVNGAIDPNVAVATMVAREQKIKRVTNALDPLAPLLMKWTNTGFPKRRLSLLRQAPPRITGRRPKSFQLSLVDEDYRLLADVEDSTAAAARGVIRVADNAGDELATPRFELTGQFGGPIKLVNVTSGLTVQFKAGFSLVIGDSLIVDFAPPYPTVTLNGADAYAQVDFLPSTWWGLRPGAQDIRVDAASGAGSWRAFWRDAWI